MTSQRRRSSPTCAQALRSPAKSWEICPRLIKDIDMSPHQSLAEFHLAVLFPKPSFAKAKAHEKPRGPASHIESVAGLDFVVIGNMLHNLAHFFGERNCDGVTISKVAVVYVHLCQGEYFPKKVFRRAAPNMLNDLPWLGDISSRIGFKVWNKPHCVEEMLLFIDGKIGSPQRGIFAFPEKS